MRINTFVYPEGPRVSKEKIRRLVRKVLKCEGKEFDTVNVIMTDDAYLRYLNETYFRKKRTTNVISFNLGDVVEIYVSVNQASDTAELHYFIIHGLLHAVGYDHANRIKGALMRKKCEGYLAHD
jgi:rRNA maturation RNase YbeY